jgi:hypothetical protein
MYGKVKRLRHHGARLSNRDVSQASFIEGDLALAALRSSYVLTVRRPDSQAQAGSVAELWDARLVTMHGDAMLFRGEERPQGEDGPAFVQEWSVRIEPR